MINPYSVETEIIPVYMGKGLAAAIDTFCSDVREMVGIDPAYTYVAHMILDDGNMDDGDILHWGLVDEVINESLIRSMDRIDFDDVDYDRPVDDDTFWYWWNEATQEYWLMLWAYDAIDAFLRWMLTIPEDDRYMAQLDYPVVNNVPGRNLVKKNE